jgi:translation initiation factor 1
MVNSSSSPIVYSTGKGGICPECGKPLSECPGKHPKKTVVSHGDGIVRIRLDTKGRKGKDVTQISGIFSGEDSLQTISRQLKRKCGAGGTVKDDVVEIQGDHRKEIAAELVQQGFKVKCL